MKSIPFRHERLAPDEALRRSRAFLASMQARRSLRFFSPEPVPRELVENAVRAAGTAPSGAHQQPWTFVVVSDPELKARLRAAAEEEEREFYERRATPEWLEALQPIGTDAVKTHITDAPYVVVVFEQAWGLTAPRGAGSSGRASAASPPAPPAFAAGGGRRKHYYVRESVGIAVGFLLAALHEAGLCALPHTPSPMGFLRELLGRPENERPYLLIPVGYPAEDATVPDLERKPLDEIAVFV